MTADIQESVQTGQTDKRKPPPRGKMTYVAIAVVTIGLLGLAQDVVTNPNFGWRVVAQYVFSGYILKGLTLTIALTVLVMLLGTLGGLVIAMMRISNSVFLKIVANCYINLFRGIPLLIQVLFWFNIAALFPNIRIGIPFGLTFAELDTNMLVTPFIAAVIALTLNEIAYMAEIIRGGLLGVDSGQYEAAEALGMPPRMTLNVILPQAIRIIIPPTANQLITTFKNTALVSVIGLADLLHSAQIVYAINYQTIPLLITASLWYLLLSSLLNWLQSVLEKRYSKGFQPRTNRRKPSADKTPEETLV